MKKVVLLTGGSSGIGRAAADWLSARGCVVYELSRRGEDRPGVRHLRGDVTDTASVAAAVQTVLDAEGRIDVLVNNAGFGISGAAEFTDLEEAKRQLDVNFFGMVRATQAVLPVMRRQGGGRIVNTSSVAGAVPIPFQSFYSVSKAAINSYTMSVQNEVRPWGIRICAVMPGDTRTGFTDARARSFAGDEEYGGRIARSVAKMEKDERTGASPETVGALIGRAALAKGGRVFYTPGVYKLVILLMRLLPSGLANRLLYMLYAS
ncbi:MAG: SDR family NAD(P)-dependent oxidoreductase [Oscillospiraceae bacterium]|nr:SDR family NAD(P)-dependent oxidoreductase [Oscillospiraceae bacterium]